MKPTRLVNLKEKFDVYIGRPDYVKAPLPGTTMFLFSNPYCWKEFGREKAVKLFKRYFKKRLHDLGFLAALNTIRGKRLACSCKPGVICHGQIIVNYLNRAEES